MSKNKYDRGISGRGIAVAASIGAFVLFVGWALLKSSGGPSAGSPAAPGELDSLVGKPLPAVQLSDKDGKPYSLDSLRGKNVVLFFNEGIMCYPACWNQVAQLGADQRFNGGDTVALSVVTDKPEQWQQAVAKMPELAEASLLFDQGGRVSRQLGLLTLPSSMHKGSIPGHTYIVLDRQGIVRYVYDDPSMAINNDLVSQKIASFR